MIGPTVAGIDLVFVRLGLVGISVELATKIVNLASAKVFLVDTRVGWVAE